LVDLRPFSAWDSHALATDGQRQAGYYIQNPGGYQQAVMWTGSAGSAVSLHPSGAQQSTATAVADGLEGGWVVYPANGAPRWAALWSGSAQSVTILNPGPSYIDSTVQGMAQGQQVGWAQVFGFNTHAALWRGTAASFVDMNPPGAAGSFL
jgi:hypothetical protein